MKHHLPVTVLEADSCSGTLVLAFGADFHVADRGGSLIASTTDDNTVSGSPVVKIEKAEDGAAIKAAAFSRDGSLLAVCTANKSVLIYETAGWTCLRRTVAEKRVNAVCFDPTGDYLVTGDKFGDSYRVSVRGEQEKHEVLLGHVSIICDVKFTLSTPAAPQQYILTCDRDEKIRVSKYPNSYNIQAFCLGHTEFVTTISTAAFAPESVVSGSGDGTVRLWNVASGRLLQTVELEQCLAKYYAEGRAVCGENTFEDRTASTERYGVLRIRACDKLHAFVAVVERIPAVIVIPFAEAAGLGSPQVIDLARAPIDVAVADDRVVVSLVPASMAAQGTSSAKYSATQVAVLKADGNGLLALDGELSDALNKIGTPETDKAPEIGSIYAWGNKMYLERPKNDD